MSNGIKAEELADFGEMFQDLKSEAWVLENLGAVVRQMDDKSLSAKDRSFLDRRSGGEK